MAKNLDVDSRRQQVSEAAWRVLVDQGLAGLSVRNVAAEAGLPPSSLRYTFPTQTSVRVHALELVLSRTLERIAAVEAGQQSEVWGRSIVHELLPLDAERRMEMEVFLALGTAAMTDPDLRPTHMQTHNAVRRICETVVSILHQGTAESARFETDRLHALIDGLALHIIRQEPSSDFTWATRTLDEHLAGIQSRS
ncbi:transcriptional regulator, TetR family [Arthrobacter sp. cf158]|uniref:TetR/AcrR family transcriptional regulator n=1 Tax=Arthrobacter sp. cf158 TaxID=1761744 RepID=UPI00089C40D8|nr:TetR family transcriptional regulator C-terminal domain-containing protein [Arthrobacter sp. cf158]SDW91343.1 transcriptional regulator, TetR family [Arthrobacter sp. cf158]